VTDPLPESAELTGQPPPLAEPAPPPAPPPAPALVPAASVSAREVFIGIAAWIVPGSGHLAQRRWGRGLVIFAAVAALSIAGMMLRGNVFTYANTDLFDRLGFFADAGAGAFYVLARYIETAGPDVSRAAGDYGTRFIASAGVLNLLCVLDAIEIARGRKA
jgi:hypothetical protein